MKLADLVAIDRAVCITVPPRWPAGYESARRQFAGLGIEVAALVNGPRGMLPPPDDAEPPRYEVAEHVGPVPRSWRGLPGQWRHRVAFLLAIERARRDGLGSILILEDDAQLAPDAAATLAAAEVPADWAMVYLGAMHHWGATRAAGRNVVRCFGARALHAVAYRASCFDALLALPGVLPLDDEIAEHLHPAMPCYAIHPPAAIQAAGVSVITGDYSAGPEFYRSPGRILA